MHSWRQKSRMTAKGMGCKLVKKILSCKLIFSQFMRYSITAPNCQLQLLLKLPDISDLTMAQNNNWWNILQTHTIGKTVVPPKSHTSQIYSRLLSPPPSTQVTQLAHKLVLETPLPANKITQVQRKCFTFNNDVHWPTVRNFFRRRVCVGTKFPLLQPDLLFPHNSQFSQNPLTSHEQVPEERRGALFNLKSLKHFHKFLSQK